MNKYQQEYDNLSNCLDNFDNKISANFDIIDSCINYSNEALTSIDNEKSQDTSIYTVLNEVFKAVNDDVENINTLIKKAKKGTDDAMQDKLKILSSQIK